MSKFLFQGLHPFIAMRRVLLGRGGQLLGRLWEWHRVCLQGQGAFWLATVVYSKFLDQKYPFYSALLKRPPVPTIVRATTGAPSAAKVWFSFANFCIENWLNQKRLSDGVLHVSRRGEWPGLHCVWKSNESWVHCLYRSLSTGRLSVFGRLQPRVRWKIEKLPLQWELSAWVPMSGLCVRRVDDSGDNYNRHRANYLDYYSSYYSVKGLIIFVKDLINFQDTRNVESYRCF